MKNETIFEVQVNGRNEFVKARDEGHANRIAQQMTNRELASAESFRDMMPTSEEFYADMGPEPYEPSPYDGTYSEM